MLSSIIQSISATSSDMYLTLQFLTVSLLGQVRFLFPVLPLINLAAAPALARLYINRRKQWLGRAVFLAAASLLAASLLATGLMTWASSHNYPGGYALKRLHELDAVGT